MVRSQRRSVQQPQKRICLIGKLDPAKMEAEIPQDVQHDYRQQRSIIPLAESYGSEILRTIHVQRHVLETILY